MKVFVVLVLALMTKGAQPNPWIFQEIKPLSDDFDTVKKSNIPEKPVKDIDPTKPSIHIKEDIRDDILGKNKSSAKFKEGVEKLLDFLEAGPKAAGDAPDNDAAQSSKTNNSKVTDSNAGKNASNFVKQHDESFSSKDKHPAFNKVNGMTANSISSENHLSSLDKDGHEESVKPLKESNSNFVNQQKEPPAIPMRSEIHLIHSNGGLVTVPSAAKMKLHNDAIGAVSNYAIMAKSQIPYAAMTYKAPTAQLLQSNTISRSKIPNIPLVSTQQRHFNPYLTSYQRSSLPYHFQTQSYNNGYTLPQHANTMATHAMRYPYNQRRMLPAMRSNDIYAAQRSNIRLPFYRSSAITSPAYNPRLPYAKAYNPRQAFNLFRKSALNPQKRYMSLATARARMPALQYPQVPRQTPYQQMPKWNLLGRNIVSKPVLPVAGMKFRRMAINDRGRAYNGISSPRDKVAQKTPLPLPLASIMTAARIVVPARPNTLNGVFKSNVETLPSTDSEEKGARAV